MLLTKWFEDPLRPTRDLDFLAVGNNDLEEMLHIFHEVCAVSFNDGVVFDPNSVKIDRIREETEYGGLCMETAQTSWKICTISCSMRALARGSKP